MSSGLRAGPLKVDAGYGCPECLVQELLRDCAPVSVTAAAFLIRLLRVEWISIGKRVAILSQQLLRPTVLRTPGNFLIGCKQASPWQRMLTGPGIEESSRAADFCRSRQIALLGVFASHPQA